MQLGLFLVQAKVLTWLHIMLSCQILVGYVKLEIVFLYPITNFSQANTKK